MNMPGLVGTSPVKSRPLFPFSNLDVHVSDQTCRMPHKAMSTTFIQTLETFISVLYTRDHTVTFEMSHLEIQNFLFILYMYLQCIYGSLFIHNLFLKMLPYNLCISIIRYLHLFEDKNALMIQLFIIQTSILKSHHKLIAAKS